MNKVNIQTERFKEITLFGHPALFTDRRLDRETLPDGFFLYEIRHADDGTPSAVENNVFVDYYGAVILPDPLVLSENESIDIDVDHDVGIGTDGIETITNFQKKYGMEPFTVYPARFDERDLFYSIYIQTPYPRIGYMRGDFGNGNEFWHTWFEHREDLKNHDFSKDFNRVVEYLRKEGYLRDLSLMLSLCSTENIIAAYEPFYGFKLRTQKYRYYIRCNPRMGDYNFYIMCYLNEKETE